MKRSMLLGLLTLYISNASAEDSELFGELIDHRDGNRYSTIKLNDYEYMADNLRYKKNGAFLYCSDDSDERNEYGCYYSAEQSKRVCPDSWRLMKPHDKMSPILLQLILRHYAGFYVHPVLEKIGFKGPYGLRQIAEKGYWWIDYPYDDISVGTVTRTKGSDAALESLPLAHFGASVLCVRPLDE